MNRAAHCALIVLCATSCVRGGYRATPLIDDAGADVGPAPVDTGHSADDGPKPDCCAPDSAADPTCGSVDEARAPGRLADGVPLRAKAVAASATHACAVDVSGALYCWGGNCSGQLGTGDAVARALPQRVTLASADEVAVGAGFTCARQGEALFCWGANDHGQLGLGDTLPRSGPQRVSSLPAVRAVAAASSTTCAITVDDDLYCWGGSSEGQTGFIDGYQDIDRPTPARVGTSAWRTVSVNQGHGCGIQDDGSLWCWGRNNKGQLGLGAGAATQVRGPQRVGAATSWVSVDTGANSSCARRDDDSLWCWGADFSLWLAFGDEVPRPAPAPIAGQWQGVSLEVFHACALAAGDLWCWGRAVEGQLGFKQADPSPPVEVLAGCAGVVVARFATFAIRNDGALLATGANSGMLGLGTSAYAHGFEEVLVPPPTR